ncbi:EAL domain-containing protein, partial [Pseudomonas aeruginosa]
LQDEDDATIVRAIIQLGKSLGMQVIAEGVETAEQEAYIIAEGCNEGQGYLYSKPLPARELTQYLKQARRRLRRCWAAVEMSSIRPVSVTSSSRLRAGRR